DLGSNAIRISGTHPLGDKAWEGNVALEDPARYATVVFAEVLKTRGIDLTGEIATSSEPLPPDARALAAHEGPAFSEMLKVINKRSQNLHVEILLRLLGQRVKGEGSVAAGHEAVQAFLKRSGVEAADMKDAAGLSRTDLLQPHEVVNLLVAMDQH